MIDILFVFQRCGLKVLFKNINKVRIILKTAFKTGFCDTEVLPQHHTGVGKFLVFKVSSGCDGKIFFKVSFQRGNTDLKMCRELIDIMYGGEIFIDIT